MLSAICFNLDQSKILSSGNGLEIFPIFRTSVARLWLDSFKVNSSYHHFFLFQKVFLQSHKQLEDIVQLYPICHLQMLSISTSAISILFSKEFSSNKSTCIHIFSSTG